MRILIFLLTFNFALIPTLQSQQIEDRELRAVWIATVLNLDWPGISQDASNQKQSFISMIDSLKKININAVFFQVRTECDALYNSSYEPWSRYLTGTQGSDPGYDPLSFAIAECHKRGIELHAWLNPYRINVSTTDGGNYYAETNIYKEHPEWALVYSNGKKILNPGLPAVQKYIRQIAGDIISKYDVDGIHFDDYFYSYDGTPSNLDNSTYLTYGSQYSTIGDFRRGSINKMIKEVYDTIKVIKPYISFGVSPFGIYGNNMNPSGIVGLDAYNVIYCDPLAWLNEGTVDYIVPQLYWPTGGSQDFGKLLPWWADKVFLKNRHVYAGHGIYRLSDNSPSSLFDFSLIYDDYKDIVNFSNLESMLVAGWTLEEIVKQINIVRQNSIKGAKGSVYFRAKDFERVRNLKKYVYENSYFFKSVIPEQIWKNPIKPEKAQNVRIEKDQNSGLLNIAWDGENTENRYAVYVITDLSDTANYYTGKNLIDVVFENHLIPDDNMIFDNLHVGVVSYNRYWRAGDPSVMYKVEKPEAPVLLSPQNEALVNADEKLIWSGSASAGNYHIEVSCYNDFRDNERETSTKNTQYSLKDLDLEGEKDYFWRVRSSNIGGYSPYSEVRKLKTKYPGTPEITNPPDNSENIELYPEFTFSYSQSTEKLHFQISKSEYSFDIYNVVDTVIDVQQKFRITKKLDIATEYFVRIKAINISGQSKWSEVNRFKTFIPLPDATQIIFPQDNSILSEELDYIQFSWYPSQGAKAYILQIADIENFENTIKEETVQSGTGTSYYNPMTKTWLYSRVAGVNEGGTGPWSPVVRFILDNNYISTKDESELMRINIFPNPCSDDIYVEIDRLLNSGRLNFEIFNNKGMKLFEEGSRYKKEDKIFRFDTEQMVCQPCYLRITDDIATQTIKFFKL
ncbi:MAG: family 10 glycosylhydrolase [Saprospiraceae bacterium]|nr:family 10 glycosylhydrolase [Saprospiraceae bacterium]